MKSRAVRLLPSLQAIATLIRRTVAPSHRRIYSYRMSEKSRL